MDGSAATGTTPTVGKEALTGEELVKMYEACIRLATENKINDRNVWSLPLIDLLPNVVKVEEQGAASKADGTVEDWVAGCRHDSFWGGVHTVAQEHWSW